MAALLTQCNAIPLLQGRGGGSFLLTGKKGTQPRQRPCICCSVEDPDTEIRVCVNRACSRSGSRTTLSYFSTLASPHIKVTSCGCLGRCGSGPNLVILPKEILVSYCGTASHVAHLLASQFGLTDPENNLAALALKERADQEYQRGQFASAEQLYSQAIDLKPSGCQYSLYLNRSAARLAAEDHSGSLVDAMEALKIKPSCHVAFLRQGEAFFALEKFEAAYHAYSKALSIEPLLRRSVKFKAKLKWLEEKDALKSSS